MKAKNGISLIVLVITIVVIIILAAAFILSLGSNNPINSSKVAKLTQSKDNIESAMSIFISSQWAKTAATEDSDAEKLVTTTSTSITTPICNVSKKFTKNETKLAIGDGNTAIDADAYLITGWNQLNVSKPADGEDWYYAPATGKVYVEFKGSTPNWATDTTDAFSVVTAK